MKFTQYIFLFLFLFTLTLPLIFLDRKSEVSKQENRTLATFPDFVKNETLNMYAINNFPKLFDSYISDRIGFKNNIVVFINKITNSKKIVFGSVVKGKNDWLFYSNANEGMIVDFLKANLFSDEQLKQFIATIEDRAKWCSANDIKFIFLIGPNKHNVYPEYYPIDRPDGITRTGQVMRALPGTFPIL